MQINRSRKWNTEKSQPNVKWMSPQNGKCIGPRKAIRSGSQNNGVGPWNEIGLGLKLL